MNGGVFQYKLGSYFLPTASRYSPDFYNRVKAECEDEMERPDRVTVDDIQYFIQDLCEAVNADYAVDSISPNKSNDALIVKITLNPFGTQPMKVAFTYNPDVSELLMDDANQLIESLY